MGLIGPGAASSHCVPAGCIAPSLGAGPSHVLKAVQLVVPQDQIHFQGPHVL